MAGLAFFLTTLVSTFFCTAVNCYTVQIAYPLWRSVAGDHFPALHQEYLKRLWPVITLPQIVMFFASAGLLWRRATYVDAWHAATIFGLNSAVIIISAFVAGPIHSRFTRERALDEPGLRRLIAISAIRVGLMLCSCWILVAVLLHALRAAG